MTDEQKREEVRKQVIEIICQHGADVQNNDFSKRVAASKQAVDRIMGILDEQRTGFTSVEQFEKQYFPNMVEKYPIVMRLTKEEERLILESRSGFYVPEGGVGD